VKVLFLCPTCETPGRIRLPDESSWQCPGCDHLLQASTSVADSPEGKILERCAICGNGEVYKKKAFPHWLGMTILVGACGAFLYLMGRHQQWWAWGVLLASAMFDGILYLLVRDVVVCYRCGAQHRGLGRSGNHPFELTIHERFRQERLRREQLRQ
jgi:ribosomal protein L37AE/L43A